MELLPQPETMLYMGQQEYIGPTVILKVGADVALAGFPSDPLPRFSMPSIVGTPRWSAPTVPTIAHLLAEWNGNEAENLESIIRYYPVVAGYNVDYTAWEKVVHRLFYGGVRVDPMEHSAALLADTGHNEAALQKMGELLFETFHVPSLAIINEQAAVLAGVQGSTSAGTQGTALIVDIGQDTAKCVPFIQTRLVVDAVKFSKRTTKIVDIAIGELLSRKGVVPDAQKLNARMLSGLMKYMPCEDGKITSESTAKSYLQYAHPDEPDLWKRCPGVMRQLSYYLKQRYFRLEEFKSAQENIRGNLVGFPAEFPDPPAVFNSIPPSLPERVLESGGPTSLSIVECIIESLTACPREARDLLSQNVLLCGGIASIPGFALALEKKLLERGKYEKILPRVVLTNTPACASWLGLSRLLRQQPQRVAFIPRQTYEDQGPTCISMERTFPQMGE